MGGVANEIDKESNSTATVTYRVTGEGTASVTYSDKDFNMAQDTAAALPWEKDVTLTGFGKLASLTATNDFDAAAGQAITCEIVVNGEVKNTQTSKGPAATANCSYSVSSSESTK
ncbi:MmpS family transport accessory protein [Gordonia sp. (in: high G+C Gram-positive bacteria)]|uniref:MmpS family transport accessory protein n=1 Tax=Gordonia sp. (in: high G+C Gram-positive bacteria) TaxID=84139 RepID=UPI003C761DE5